MAKASKKKKAPKKTSQKKTKKSVFQSVAASVSGVTFPVVAIGASAGGFEAFSTLLRALPPEPGMVLIFIPHLDPTHESAMVDLLARTTKIPVVQATEGVRVACNTLYVLPPNSEMTIEEDTLHLAEREPGRAHHMPIDTFFRSLAADQTSNAIGVILSGTANDGTLGLSAIKGASGITFVQDPDSAKYDGMPNSAIAAGVVDYVF